MMPYGWKVILNGDDISDKVSRFSIACSLRSFCREMSLDISDPALYATLDFSQVSEYPEIEIFTRTGEDWVSQGEFFIERPALATSVNADVMQGVWGRSLTALLAEPFAPKVSKAWETKTTLFSIIEEMCDLAGLEWDPAYSDIDDLVIFAHTYEADGVYPIDVIAELALLAGAVVTTDRQGHLCLKRIDYAPAGADVTITDADIASITERPEWPTFGNRVRITPTGSLASHSIDLFIPEPCLKADGSSKAKLFAQVRDPDGEPVNGLVVNWSIDSDNASLDAASSNTQQILIRNEQKRADDYYHITVDFQPSAVDGIWAYADTGKRTNLAAAGYEVDRNTIALAQKLGYCDQLLVISYRAEGMAVNYLRAGEEAEDVTVVADMEGQRASGKVHIDNPCECPPRITLRVNPSSIHPGEVSRLLVYVEESGAAAGGRVVFMSENTAVKRGALDWTVARLGEVRIANEQTAAVNEIAGTSQCEISMFPTSVTSVYRADDDGKPVGGNLYASHAGKVIDLSAAIATGTELLVNYVAQGAALNRFVAQSVGTARIVAYIFTTTEQGAEASATISIVDANVPIENYPEEWDGDGEYGGVGGTDDEFDETEEALCRQSDGTTVNCQEGQRCCWKGDSFGCWPEEECTTSSMLNCQPANVSADPSQSALEGRFVAALGKQCTCEEICSQEFSVFGTTQNYDGASYRTIHEIITEDHELAEGTPEYWEKFAELKQAAIDACLDQCCGDSASLAFDAPFNSGHYNASGQSTVNVSWTGGMTPFTVALSGAGQGFSLSGGVQAKSNYNAREINLLAEAACGAVDIEVTDACGRKIVCRMAVGNYYEDDDWYEVPYSGVPYSRKFNYHRTIYNAAGEAVNLEWKQCILAGEELPLELKYGCNNPGGTTMCSGVYCYPEQPCGHNGTWCFGTKGGCA